MKLCKACARTLPLDDFYTSFREVEGRQWKHRSTNCKKCHSAITGKNVIARARQNKAKAVALLGGKCLKCAGVFHPASYDFHHRNPKEKSFCVGERLAGSWAVLLEELKKCDLLCRNCHSELEAQYV